MPRLLTARRLPALVAMVLAAHLLAGAAEGQGSAPPAPTAPTIEKPFLWRIEGAPPSFLFGSIHLPDERVHAQPEVVWEALGLSEVVLTEIPLDMEAMISAQASFLVPDSSPLSKRLPPDLYARVDTYLQSKGLQIALFEGLKVWALSVTLGQLDYLAELMERPALDMALWQAAGDEGKERAALETLEEQLAALESFTLGEQVQLLQQTMDDLEAAREGASPTEELVVGYVSGELDDLYALLTENVDMESISGRKFVKLLIDERNERMAARIRQRLEAARGRSHFFVIGVLHFPGKGGLLERLRATGYGVTRLGPGADLTAPSPSPAKAVGE